MNITVHFVGNQYRFIAEDGRELYTGRMTSSWVLFGIKKELITAGNQRVCFASDQKITIGDEITMLIYTTKRTWECVGNNIDYFLVPHKGRKTSIFKAGKQVGFYEKASVYSAAGAFISMVADSDCDIDLVSSLVFALECNFDDNEAINLNFGWIGKEYRNFDNNWRPN